MLTGSQTVILLLSHATLLYCWMLGFARESLSQVFTAYISLHLSYCIVHVSVFGDYNRYLKRKIIYIYYLMVTFFFSSKFLCKKIISLSTLNNHVRMEVLLMFTWLCNTNRISFWSSVCWLSYLQPSIVSRNVPLFLYVFLFLYLLCGPNTVINMEFQ